MTLIRDFGNSSNWELFYNVTFTAENLYRNVYAPIPAFFVPLRFSNFIIAINVSCSTAKSGWYFAGFANVFLQTGLDRGGNPDSIYGSPSRLTLDAWQIIEVPQVSSTFSLKLTPPKYFRDISYGIQIYTGASGDTVDNAVTENVIPDLAVIKAKIGA